MTLSSDDTTKVTQPGKVPDYMTVIEQRDAVASGKFTATEILEHSLARIAKLDGQLNAFSAVLEERARKQAAELDEELKAGKQPRPLHGVTVGVKEENPVAGAVTYLGGAGNTEPETEDGEIVKRLVEAGAVVVGTTRMPEFGLWPFTESDTHGLTRNPWNPEYSPAGSSGGTGAAIAAGMVAGGIGGDGGGSIRLPSAWNGLFGVKSQRGRFSSGPSADLWRALGVRGPMALTVEDNALLWDVLQGTTSTDRWHADPVSMPLSEAAKKEPGKLRIAVAMNCPVAGMGAPDPAVVSAVHQTADLLASLGHEVVDQKIKYPDLTLPFIIQVSGGVRDETATLQHPERIESKTKIAHALGKPLEGALSWAENTGMKKGKKLLDKVFSDFDVILMPTVISPPLKVPQVVGKNFAQVMPKASKYAAYCSVWNVTGNPAAAVPSGFTRDGLPLSSQIVGPMNSEAELFQLAGQIERARPWADKHPPL